jgi:Arm DNA-binding domain
MAKGSIRRRGATWSVVVDAGRDPSTGRRKQLTKGGFRTRREAETWNREQLGRLDRGDYVKPSRLTFGEHLATWLPAIRDGPALHLGVV